MTVSCYICYHVFDIMLSFAFELLFTVFFTTVKTLPWTARSKECYWLVGVFENRVVKKNTFKAPESFSRRTDSLESSKVEKARKNRAGDWRESLPLSLSLSSPLPPCFFFCFCFFFFLCVDLYFVPFPTIWTPETRQKLSFRTTVFVSLSMVHTSYLLKLAARFCDGRVYCLVRIRPWRTR